MSQNAQKVAKIVEDSDRISSLPDELLGNMLSFLPTWSAMRTSVLSKRWRYLFTLTNCLNFDDSPCSGSNDGTDEIIRKIVIRQIYRIMKAHQMSPIKEFSLDFRGKHDESALNTCLSYAVEKGVQDLDFEAVVPEYYEPPDDLLACQTLVRLRMASSGENRIWIPLSARLPNLKVLQLESVKFSDFESAESLFSGCKMLEELTLKCCKFKTTSRVTVSASLLKILTLSSCSFEKGLFEIDAPNLACLSYEYNTGVNIVPSWKDSCSLAKAELSFCHDAEDGYTLDSLEQDYGLIKAAADKVTELHFTSDSLEYIRIVAGHEEMPDFHSLSKLGLCACAYSDWKYVISLLENSPQLETIIFERCAHGCGRSLIIPPKEDLITFTCHAKLIEIRDFRGGESSLLVLGHLLRNSRVLKRLVMHPHYYYDKAQKLQLSKDLDTLLLLPRASKDCCIDMK